MEGKPEPKLEQVLRYEVEYWLESEQGSGIRGALGWEVEQEQGRRLGHELRSC